MCGQKTGREHTHIPPDRGVCERCVRELFNPADRRSLYPFINCPDCGPGYTIATLSPFRRELTSMSRLNACKDCTKETTTPTDRRFNSQTSSCVKCGPKLSLLDEHGKHVFSRDPIKDTIAHIKMGKIVAVKVTGGFHLVCDGTNEASVSRLQKKFPGNTHKIHIALPSISALKQYCHVSENEKKIISGKERPVLLMEKKNCETLAPSLTSDLNRPGFMLPRTPVHYLLFGSGLNDTRNHFFSDNYKKDHFHFEALAIADSSVYTKNDARQFTEAESVEMLTQISDLFLTDNVKEVWHCEDSVIQEIQCVAQPDGTPATLILNRSKGFLPAPIAYLKRRLPPVFACGSDHNNSFCIANGESVFPGPLFRDLGNTGALNLYRDTIDHFITILRINPEYIVVDKNKSLHSTRYGINLKKKCIETRHSHSHIAAVIAEHSLEGEVIGISLDCPEPDDDGHLGGSEIFRVTSGKYITEGHFKPYRLPGGLEHTRRQPWRTAAGLLYNVFGDSFTDTLQSFTERVDKENALSIKTMIDTENSVPLTSGASCFLESLASLIDIRYVTAFEGEASRRLADIADKSEEGRYGYSIDNRGIIDFSPMIKESVKEISQGTAPVVSAKFHNTIAHALLESCLRIKKTGGTDKVVLAGEAFLNTHLLCRLAIFLQKEGFTVCLPRQFPIHDGGTAPGQLAIAALEIDKR